MSRLGEPTQHAANRALHRLLFRSTLIAFTAACAFSLGYSVASGQPHRQDARWIWIANGLPGDKAEAGTVWFRKVFRAEEPSSGAALVIANGPFTLWVNGKKVGSGTSGKAHRLSLSGIAERGNNVFCVEAKNQGDAAGLFIDAEIRGQSGHGVPADTSGDWKATTTAPVGDAWTSQEFDDGNWSACKDLGSHAESRWAQIELSRGELDRFQPADGFEITQIAGPELSGSLVAMTWGNRGRLLVSKERGPVSSLIDDNHDGVYDRIVVYSNAVKNCQGMCQVFNNLYLVGDGPNGTGIYRLPDENGDDVADGVYLVSNVDGGMGEHGPHDIVYGPDGELYFNLGNHAWVKRQAEATTPCRNEIEGNLLEPKFEDAGGHAVGIKAPGGTIWRFSPDGSRWWMETAGFRNQYDIAFNSRGDLFSFDSDMEWDVNLPWYRPVRINHCIPGAEFGWRSGAAVTPDYCLDNLPTTIDVGRGSPTGVVFYEHTHFPESYRGTLLNCDWSLGRLIVAHLETAGATYRGSWDNLVTGNPLNISDVEVDRDGTVVFCTGGRGTQGGVFRITHSASKLAVPAAKTVADAVAMPQSQSNWARELISGIKATTGDRWHTELAAVLQSGSPAEKVRAATLLTQFGPAPTDEQLVALCRDADANVRQFGVWLLGTRGGSAAATVLAERLSDSDATVARRACEAFVRSGLEAPTEPVIKLLAHNDRWLRFAARVALERVPVAKWKGTVLAAEQPDVVLLGSLALGRIPNAITGNEQVSILGNLLLRGKLDSRQRLDVYRSLSLAILHGTNDAATKMLRGVIAEKLFADFKAATAANAATDQITHGLRMETSRLLAKLNMPAATPLLVAGLSNQPDRQLQIHYALCLRYLSAGWTLDSKRALLAWYETTRNWDGGNSLQGYIRNIVAATLEWFSPEERTTLFTEWAKRPHATRLLAIYSSPNQFAAFENTVAAVFKSADASLGMRDFADNCLELLGKSDSAAAQVLLRAQFDADADRRDQLARVLARVASAENVPYMLKGIATGDKTTSQICLQALTAAPKFAAQAGDLRSIIIAAIKLGPDGGGKTGLAALERLTESNSPNTDDFAASIGHYQQWYAQKFPDAIPAELTSSDSKPSKYSYDQLVEFLDHNPAGASGDVERGKLIFKKANCVKCHRFSGEGEGVGPELTTLRRRFQRREIVESITEPSKIISDQFAAITVITKAGLVHTGMPLPNQGVGKLVLLLSDATRLELDEAQIEERVTARTSVMPEGLFDLLTLEEIADLFAFLETSKQNVESAAATTAGGGR